MAIYLASDERYKCLLHSAPDYPVHYHSKRYWSAENLFQSLKFEGYHQDIADAIRVCTFPLAKAQEHEEDIRADWFDVNITMMRISLQRKFTAHRRLAALLQGTTGRELINNVEDPFWGIGNSGGRVKVNNNFGRELMLLRDSNEGEPALPPIPSPIKFYNANEPHYGFTNFSDHAVACLGATFRTSEQLFQAFKFSHEDEIVEKIYKSTTPRQVYDTAQEYKDKCRDDWQQISKQVMTYILYLKFTQHPELKTELLDTGGAMLIENSPTDSFWGCGADGKGGNHLGKALVRVRSMFKRGCPEPLVPPNPPHVKTHITM